MEEKSTSEVNFGRLWQQLTHNQRRFAVAMLDSPTKKDAAIACNLEPNTVYKWNGIVDDVVEILLDRAADSAYEILRGQVVKASMVKVAGLDSSDEKMRQAVAEEVLDRVMGKPTQRQEVSGPGGGPLAVEHDIDRDTIAEALRILGRADGGQGGRGA
jgi:hypothetical protein